MGHRHAISRVVETVYLSDHVPIDRLHSEQAREAAGRSLGIAAPAASTTVLANPRVAKVLQVSRKLQEAVMLDRLLACKVPRLAVELINDDGWAEHLSNEQLSLVERLQEAETDFLSAFGWATAQLTSPTHATAASSHMQSQRQSAQHRRVYRKRFTRMCLSRAAGAGLLKTSLRDLLNHTFSLDRVL